MATRWGTTAGPAGNITMEKETLTPEALAWPRLPRTPTDSCSCKCDGHYGRLPCSRNTHQEMQNGGGTVGHWSVFRPYHRSRS